MAAPLLSDAALEAKICAVTIKQTLSKPFFSICSVDAAMKMRNMPKPADQRAYNLLYPLHCVDYANMDSGVKAALPHLIGRVLGLNSMDMLDNNYAAAVAATEAAAVIDETFWQRVKNKAAGLL
jgi:hypothetical protein